MVTLEVYRKLVQELAGSQEQIHSGMPAFAVGKKRFAIFNPKTGKLALKPPLTDSVRIEAIARGVLEPAPGRYGAEGWASVDLERIEKTEFVQLLNAAYHEARLKAFANRL